MSVERQVLTKRGHHIHLPSVLGCPNRIDQHRGLAHGRGFGQGIVGIAPPPPPPPLRPAAMGIDLLGRIQKPAAARCPQVLPTSGTQEVTFELLYVDRHLFSPVDPWSTTEKQQHRATDLTNSQEGRRQLRQEMPSPYHHPSTIYILVHGGGSDDYVGGDDNNG